MKNMGERNVSQVRNEERNCCGASVIIVGIFFELARTMKIT